MESIIFGSAGFIGKHLSETLSSGFKCFDLNINSEATFCDVREPINIELESKVNTIFNFAAVHTTPGHEYQEYFETNIKGAENICAFARINNINTIIFTSSSS